MAQVDASIPLSVRKPEFMSPAQAISLQSMVQQMQAQKLQQTQALSAMAKQQQIQQRLSQPDAVDSSGLFTPLALADITRMDASTGIHLTGQVQRVKDEQAQAKSRTLADQANRVKLAESLEKSQNEILEQAVSFVDSTMPKASQEEKDRAVREKVQAGLTRQKDSGLYDYSDEQWNHLKQYPYTYGDAKARVTPPDQLRKENVPLSEVGKIRQDESKGLISKKDADAMATKKEGLTVKIDQGGPQPTDETIEMDAWRYLTDGTLPPNMGRGAQGSGQATKIRNRASVLADDMGMKPDEIRFAQLENKTKVAALGQLAKAKAQILQFEKTAEANAELALKAAKDVWRSDSPWINKPLNAIRQQGQGDPKFAVFNAANETFVSEYARVMSGGYGAAQTTEGAQIRAHGLLNTSMSQPQYEAVVKQLKAEMKNREKALNDQMQEERDNLRGIKVKPMRKDEEPSTQALTWSDEDEKRLQELEKKRAQ